MRQGVHSVHSVAIAPPQRAPATVLIKWHVPSYFGSGLMHHAGTAVRVLLLASVLAVSTGAAILAGCVSAASDEAERRRNMVVVPEDAEPVERILWDDVRNTTILNRRMVLMTTRDRTHLLVFEKPCPGLTRNSIVYVPQYEDRYFEPSIDVFRAIEPYPGVTTGAVVGAIQGTSGAASVVGCFPDTLYAIKDEDVEFIRKQLERED